MKVSQKITPFLSFQNRAEEAAQFYVSLLPNSKILRILKDPNTHAVITVEFELAGMRFVALNSGQSWEFTHAFSISVSCENQQEIDILWSRLTEQGHEVHCGWLTDKFGVSWQIVPANIADMIGDGDPEKSARVMAALMQMTKIDSAKLQAAYEGR